MCQVSITCKIYQVLTAKPAGSMKGGKHVWNQQKSTIFVGNQCKFRNITVGYVFVLHDLFCNLQILSEVAKKIDPHHIPYKVGKIGCRRRPSWCVAMLGKFWNLKFDSEGRGRSDQKSHDKSVRIKRY